MDPNATLTEIRSSVDEYVHSGGTDVDRLTELFAGLDEWMSKGGFAPSAWASDETYNGWANRETWAFNLHWQNDQGLYLWVLEQAQEVIDHATMPPVSDLYLGERVVGIVRDELEELSPELWELMRTDVGSFWRIDCEEVGRTVRESLDNEA